MTSGLSPAPAQHPARAGRFITFEGIDGAGKSTHIETVAARLRGAGTTVVCTREPGGTPLAETLRRTLLQEPMDALTESLIVFAARQDHLRQVIRPALVRGDTVLCDRFTDATFAYQGGARGADPHMLAQLEQWVQAGLQPDLTLVFDLPPELAAQRRAASRAADRFEQEDVEFFERVRQGYRARFLADPARFGWVDAAGDRQAVWRSLQGILESKGW